MSKKIQKYLCQCPICNFGFKKYMPYGDTNRQNAMCPKCGSIERYRLLYLYLLNETKFFEKNKAYVLEIGPIKCSEKIFQKKDKDIDYISVDKYRHTKAEIISDATNLSFQDNVFDLIICYHVLEHIKDDIKAMVEIFRVLKPQGMALIQVPIDVNRKSTFEDSNVPKKIYEEIFGQKDHVRIYGIDFKKRLERVGFNVARNSYIKNFSKKECLKFGLKDRYSLKLYTTCEDIYICKKS